MNSNIKQVWEENGAEWIKLLDSQGIASRAITNPAIVDTVLSYAFEQICDVGCGEGWLVRALREQGRLAHGVGACEPLIPEVVGICRTLSINPFLFPFPPTKV